MSQNKVWTLMNDDGSYRGKTHAYDCYMFRSFTWQKSEYVQVDAKDIPDNVGRCGFCGGGR